MPKLYWEKKDENHTQKSNYSQNEFQVCELLINPIISSIVSDNEVLKNKRSMNQKQEKGSTTWKNLLIWGENKSIMRALNDKFSNKINLIYIDPPYATGSNFESKTFIGESNSFESKKAYSDTWDGGIDEYIDFLYDRLVLMKNLLSENGSIYVHLDWHVSHYIKVILDEIFGKENFKNEIIWAYPAASAKTRRFFIRSFDSILFYTKSSVYTFNDDPGIYMEAGTHWADIHTLMNGIAVAGDYAFVAARANNGLYVFDVSDPQAMTLVTSYGAPGRPEDVALLGDYAYIAGGTGGVTIFDVSDPSAPLQVNVHKPDEAFEPTVAVAWNGYLLVKAQYSRLAI